VSKLRPYQVQATAHLSHGWKLHKRQVLAMTTGSGKTYTFAYMAKLAAERNKTVLILTHRTELFSQTFDTFQDVGLDPYIINADGGDPPSYTGVFVVMVETLARRQELMDRLHPDLIIIDEAHFGNFTKIIDAYPDAYVLGVTATPIGKHFFEYYTNIVQPIDTPDLIAQGFLVPYKAYQMKDDFSDLKKGASGDYSEKSQFGHFDKDKLYDGVIEEWNKRCQGEKTVVFNCNIKHSNEMAAKFNAAGIKSYSLTSQTSAKDRKRMLDEFHNGDCMVLNNNGILTTGYDHPPIKCIILNRASDSLTLFLQMVGRGSRTFPGKTGFVCLDFGGNHSRHGLWSHPRKWELKDKRRTKEGEAAVKDCPVCEAMIYAGARICEYCGHEFPIVIKGLKDGVMEEYYEKDIPDKPLNECSPEEFALLVRLDRLARGKAIGMMRRRGRTTLSEFARHMNYSQGWVHRQMSFVKKKEV